MDRLLKLENSTENAGKEKVMLNLDSSKAKKQLGWFAQMPIPTLLSRTRRWYEMSIEGAPVDLLCQAGARILSEFYRSQ